MGPSRNPHEVVESRAVRPALRSYQASSDRETEGGVRQSVRVGNSGV